tara:strand:- start:107 stop:283 length:177 start_codon:yes stop_codon:yes gene_type:complete
MENKDLIDKLAKAAIKIKMLQEINEAHREMNGELREEIKKLKGVKKQHPYENGVPDLL